MMALNYQHVNLIAAADWSCNIKKCWMAEAIQQPDSRWRLFAPRQVTDPRSLLKELWERTPQPGSMLLGFDFPVGLPDHYAQKAGISNFVELLTKLGKNEWGNFFQVASEPGEIALHRPFYPNRPGRSKRHHLTTALGLVWDDLLRKCDCGSDSRPDAAALFWTMGAKQVGKAALHGWQNVFQPALEMMQPLVNLWPFSGFLDELLQPGNAVIAEIYPAEYYARLGVTTGKRSDERRKLNAVKLLLWAVERGIELDPSMADQMRRGFPQNQGGEDAFDATVGLLGMLESLVQDPKFIEPTGDEIRNIEGWILGQPPIDKLKTHLPARGNICQTQRPP